MGEPSEPMDAEETRSVASQDVRCDAGGVEESGADAEETKTEEEDGVSSWFMQFLSGSWWSSDPEEVPATEESATREGCVAIESAEEAAPSASDHAASYQFNGDFRMVQTVTSTDEIELNAEEGEAIYVMEIDESRRADKLGQSWALAVNVQGQRGLVPFDAIRREIYVTSVPFEENSCGYVTLRGGDPCVVYHRAGDWAFGARVEASADGVNFVEGWFPSPASPLPAFPPPSLVHVPARPAMSSPDCTFQ